MAVDWTAMKAEYITSDISYRRLAAKYGVSATQVFNRGGDEKWPELRKQHLSKTLARSIEKSSRKKADQMARIDRVTDKLLDKLEKAVEELEIHLVTHTRKEKTIEYTDLRPDKPKREVINETEELLQVAGIVDKAGLRQISAALKDIKEIKMLRSALDEQEQEARIESLRRKNEADNNTANEVVVRFMAGEEEWNE